MELLQNPIVQIVVFPILIFIAGIYVNRYFSKTRKDLSYSREIWPLIEDSVGSRLRVHFNNQPVENVAIVVVHLSYKGNEPIRREDYEQVLTFDFDASSRVLDAEVLDTKPTNMNPVVTSESDTRVRLEPVLFNDGNRMTIKMLVENGRKVPDVDGRIAGVSQLRNAAALTSVEKVLLYTIENSGWIAIISLPLAVVSIISAFALELESSIFFAFLIALFSILIFGTLVFWLLKTFGDSDD